MKTLNPLIYKSFCLKVYKNGLNDAKQLSPYYIADTGMRKSLADTPNPEQAIIRLLASGDYVLSPMETNDAGYTHSLSKVGLAGGRKLADTIAMLDNCLKTGQKVVFISYRWSKETDPQVDRLCESLNGAGIIALRDKESFEAGERIDEYMETIKHPAVVQTIILADNEDEKGCYVKSRNCMNEMQLAFRNKALADAHVTLVPLSDKSIEEYTLKSHATIEDWQGRKDKFIQDGNFIEAGVADNVINNTKTFIRQLANQNNKTLAQIERSGYKDLVDRINNTPVRPDNRNRSLPFKADPHYIANPMEHALIERIAPNRATLLVGAKQSGKTRFLEQSLLKMGADLFELFPNGVITIDALGKSQAELLQTISNASGTLFIVDNLKSELSASQVQELLPPTNGLVFTSTTTVVSGIPKLELTPLTAAQQLQLLTSYLTTYIPKHSEEQLVQIAKLCDTPLEIAACGNYLVRTNMPMASFLYELGQDRARILSATGGQIQQARIKTAQQVTSQSEAKTSELMAALDESLKNKQKVVLFSDFAARSSNADSDELVHTGATVAQQLKAAGIMVIQANHNRDTYLQILNHKAVVQSVIVVDKNYLYDTSCMLAMEAIFRNEHLTTGRVTLIPASGDLYVAYQRNLGELERHWQGQPEGKMILGNIPLFLRAMGMQNSQMLAGVEQENSKTVIEVIKQTKPVETKPLPFTANPNYVGRAREQDWIMENLAPGRVLTLVGEGGLGKSALVRQTIASVPQDIGIMYPEGVLMVDFEAKISVEQAMTQIVLGLEPSNDGKDIPGSYKRLVANRPALTLLDATENVKADELNQLFLTSMKSSIIVTTRRSSDAPDDKHLLKLAHLSKSEQETLLLSYVEHYDATQEQGTLNSILDILGGLPIALELAGSYLKSNPVSLADFLKLLRSNPEKIASQVTFLTQQNVLQLDKLEYKEVAQSVLGVLANTANAPLSVARICEALITLYPSKNLDTHIIYHEVLCHLHQLGLIKPDSNGNYAIVHSLVYSCLKQEFQLNDELYQAIVTVYDKWLTGAKDQWPEIDEQIPHLISLFKTMLEHTDYATVNALIDRLVTKVRHDRHNYYIFNSGSYDNNLNLLQLKLQGGELSNNEAIIADSYNSIGELQQKFALYTDALTNYEQALAIRKASLGDKHPDVAITLNNIRIVKNKINSQRVG